MLGSSVMLLSSSSLSGVVGWLVSVLNHQGCCFWPSKENVTTAGRRAACAALLQRGAMDPCLATLQLISARESRPHLYAVDDLQQSTNCLLLDVCWYPVGGRSKSMMEDIKELLEHSASLGRHHVRQVWKVDCMSRNNHPSAKKVPIGSLLNCLLYQYC